MKIGGNLVGTGPGGTLDKRQSMSMFLVGETRRPSRQPHAAINGRTSVVINGRWHALRGRSASFEQLHDIAFPGRSLSTSYNATVAFRNGSTGIATGIMTPGEVITLEEGLAFTVSSTNAS